MIENEKFIKRTKYIDIRFHAIKQLKEDGIIELKYSPTKYMTPYVLTKLIPNHELIRRRIDMKLLANPSEELKGKC